MQEIRLIEVKEEILSDNKEEARKIRERLQSTKTMLVNLMSSPGSGKTSLILRTVERLQGMWRLGVIEADIDSVVDAQKVAARGVPAVQLRTDGFCHLDAAMVDKGIAALDVGALDLIIIENVGNLVCPAEFDTGAHRSVMILSVPEGDDKPLKYPVMFAKADAVVVTKTDYLDREDFDVEAVRRRVEGIRPDSRLFTVSARTGMGMPELARFLQEKIRT